MVKDQGGQIEGEQPSLSKQDKRLSYEAPGLIKLGEQGKSFGLCMGGSGNADCRDGNHAVSCMFGFMGAVQPPPPPP